MKFVCHNPECKREFFSKHSVAKFCCRSCSAKYNGKYNTELKKHGCCDRKYTDEFLINNLIEYSKKIGKTPSTSEIGASGVSSTTYSSRFGSYNKAVVIAGLVPNNQIPPSLYKSDRHQVSPKMRFAVLKRDGFRCKYCGGTPDQGYLLHVDHIVPFSKGGLTDMDNLVTSCSLCNIGKGNMGP
jgi:hypothetical protein